MKKFVPILLFLIMFVPVFVNAEIIPSDCGNIVNGKLDQECGWLQLIQLVNNLIDWVVYVSIPVAAGVFAWAGFILMTTAVADKKSYAKDMMWKVFLGLVAILAAWLIVDTILDALLDPNIRSMININK